MNLPIELVIWDMDGTLINSATAVPDAFISAAETFGKSGYSREDVIGLYTLGVPENVVAHMLGKPVSPNAMECFYDALQKNSSTVATYDEVTQCLALLHKKVKQAVFTGASQRSAEILLTAVGIDHHFDVIKGGDGYPPKPDPTSLIDLAEQFGVAQNRCVYIGDATADMEAANSANMISVAAGWGHLYHSNMNANKTVNSPMQLSRLICGS